MEPYSTKSTGTHLRQAMLAREARAPVCLHQAGVVVPSRLDSDIAAALLHNYAKEDARFDQRSILVDGHADTLDVCVSVARGGQFAQVALEEGVEVQPGFFGREIRGRAGD